MHSPVEQFILSTLIPLNLFGINVDFTNSALFMVLAIIIGAAILFLSMHAATLVPHRAQNIAEMAYEFIADMIETNVGRDGRPYFPIIFTLFMFILFANLLGLLPYSYTSTSQIIVTFSLALFIFIGVTLIAIWKHGLHFLTFFVPQGAPKPLMPFIACIEVVSYFVRPVSLSVRLFANMLAGHTMLKVFAGLAVLIASAGNIWGIGGSVFPLLAIIGLTGLEILVAVLQAYVFAILTCLYLNDALHLH